MARQISPVLVNVMRRAHIALTFCVSASQAPLLWGCPEAEGIPSAAAFRDLNSGVSPDLHQPSRPFLIPCPWDKILQPCWGRPVAEGMSSTTAFRDLNSGVDPDMQLASRPFLTPFPWGKTWLHFLRLAGAVSGLDGGVLIRRMECEVRGPTSGYARPKGGEG